MFVERLRPMTFQVTLHAMELATLISAARCVVEGRQGELTPEARGQMKRVLEGYDRQHRRLAVTDQSR
ncbi:MAG: hypothetical protein K0U98_27475 [Deltaproteobacteria bacterium]|nr:hypothetical protein [Deltaproteobacteria bacterium]